MSQNLNSTKFALEQENRLVKTLSRFDIIFFIIAAYISLDTIGSIAAGGSQALFWSLFVVITFMLPNAFMMAETGSAFPEEGGPYQWVKFAYGRFAAAIASVLYWITNPLWLGGSLCFIAFDTFNTYVHKANAGHVGEWLFKLVFIWMTIGLAIISLKLGKKIINWAAFAKLAVLAIFVLTTAVYGLKNGFQPLDFKNMAPSIAGFMAVAPVILFSYVGFEAPNAASGEMLDPKRDTAPAIRIGSLVSALAYLLPVLSILLVLPKKDVQGLAGYMSAVETVFSVYGAMAKPLLAVAGLLFIFGLMGLGASWMMATDRIQAMAAADGAFLNGWFGEFSRKFGTPMRVNILSGVMSSIFLAAGMKLVNGNTGAIFKVVLSCAVSTLLVSYLLIIPSVMKLNRGFKEVNRPYRAPGGIRGFQFMGTIVFLYILIGSFGVIFPGTLESILGIGYNFKDIWGLSRTNVQLFTLTTIVVDILIGVGGYLLAKKVRQSLVKGDPTSRLNT
jgi:glutamate:GABA antiporter